jgi:dihydroorotase
MEQQKSSDSLILRRPDDFHVHLRDGPLLAAVAPYTARQFTRAVVMPNLDPPVTSLAQAAAYKERILAACAGRDFTPLMTLYLTDASSVADLRQSLSSELVFGCKLYPANATTNAHNGVRDVQKLYPVFELMQETATPLLMHGEMTDPEVDVFDREAVFIDRVLAPLTAAFPGLKVVLEHITTAEAAEFVASAGANVGATITPHHLHINRNAMFDGGLRPHHYCLPVAKRESHRLALRRAATSGMERFFAGTDSAPHLDADKQSACGCAGIFNAPFAMESYATVFEEEDALDRLEAFAAENGARFYGLVLNEARIVLERAANVVPAKIETPTGALTPFHAGTTLRWRSRDPVQGASLTD